VSDLLPPEALALEAAGDVLAEHFTLTDHGVGETRRRFYDTFDGLLHEQGLSLVGELGRLTLVDQASGIKRATLAAPEPEAPFMADELAPGPLRDALGEVTEIRALLTVAEVRCRTRRFEVLDERDKTVARVLLEEPMLASGKPLHPRARLVGLRGYDKALQRVRGLVVGQLGFTPASVSLLDEAVLASGGVPGGCSAKVRVTLDGAQRADSAAKIVLRALLEVIEANLDGTMQNIDIEFLHDLRVSVRRTRSVLRQLRPVFPSSELAGFVSEFRWLQRATGDARDLDVYVQEFDSLRALAPEPMRPDLEPLLAALVRRRAEAHGQMGAALSSQRAVNLLADWSSFLEELVERPEADRPAARTPIGELAGRRIAKVYERIVTGGRAIDSSSPAEAYHELRKKGKELRYLLELFGAALFDKEAVTPMIKALKALQDVLGRHQDREIQIALLLGLSDEVSRSDGGAAALMAMGVLVEHLRTDEQAARTEFGACFDAFSAKPQRELVRETFA
jgi:CHAD domain-containing protein